LAYGSSITSVRQSVLLNYVDGLKAAGAQRVDLNPAVTSINDPNATALYDAVVQHVRALGMQLSLNPEIMTGELGSKAQFSDFQNAALLAYPLLAARYKPDNFVIVHEPTVMAARLGITTSPSDWTAFISAVAPLIKAASPRTRLGAGGYYDEDAYYEGFVGMPVLDFTTMEVYDTANFDTYTKWVQEAHAAADPAHPNGKGVYIDQTWAPFYLPSTLPPNWQSQSLDDLALVGSCNGDFTAMDANWLQLMSQFASANQMEAVTAFTTEAFFQYGTAGADKPDNTAYNASAQAAIQAGQLTSTGQAFQANSQKWGIKQATSISSASFATFPTVFNPTCGTGGNPCNANATVAPDGAVSAFGADLGTGVGVTSSVNLPTNLAGTTMTLTDSSNTKFDVGMYSVSPGQINYLAPSGAKPGPAAITVTSGDGTQTTGTVLVATVAPGIYTANQSGSGLAAGYAVCGGTCSGWTNPQGNGQFMQSTTQPFSLGSASDVVVVELFGTGIRHVASLSDVTATINGQSVTVYYAGPQGQFAGLDQVNVQVPHSLAGSGVVNVVLTVAGVQANTVTVHIQ